MEASDWRTHVSTSFRAKIVQKIMDVLRKCIPPSEDCVSQLKKIKSIAVNFEEKTYREASDHTEYMRKIMVRLMAGEGSLPNVWPKSSVNSPCIGLKPSNLVANQGHSNAVQSTDQSQACEVPEKHSLPDIQNNSVCVGVSANLAPAQTTVNASAQVLLPSHNQYSLKSVGSSSGKGISFNESANNITQEQVKQHSSCIDTHPNLHYRRQVRQDYFDPHQNHQQQDPNLCKKAKQEHIALLCITQKQQAHQQHHHHRKEYFDSQNHQQLDPNLCKQVKQDHVASCITPQQQIQQHHHRQGYFDPQKNHQQLNSNVCKQFKQERVALSCQTQQQQVHQHHHQQQKVLKHAQPPQQSVIPAPLLRTSEMRVAPLSDCRQDQISSSQQKAQSVIKNLHQTPFGKNNPQATADIHQSVSSTPEHLLAQPHKQQHVTMSRLAPTNLQQNQLIGQPNGLHDMKQQHHRLPLQHNNVQEFKGQSTICSTANQEAQKNNISVLHGSSELPEGGSSGKHQCQYKRHGGTRQNSAAVLANQEQKSRPQILESQLNSQSESKQMQNLPSTGMQTSGMPASASDQTDSTVDSLQEELYQKVENLKIKYLASLTDIYIKITSYLQKIRSTPEHPDRLNHMKLKNVQDMYYAVKFYIVNVSVSKSKITPACKEKLGLLEEKIITFIHIFEQRKHAILLQHETPSNIQSMPQSVQPHSQAPQDQISQDEKKPQLLSVNKQRFDSYIQNSNVKNMGNGSVSLSEPPIQQHDLEHLRQNFTQQDSEQANSLRLVNRVPLEHHKSSPQQPSHILSRNLALKVESHVNPCDSRLSKFQDMQLKQTNEQPDTKPSKQELQRHEWRQQLVQPKQQIVQQHLPSQLQSRDLTPNPLARSLKPSSHQVPQHSFVSEKKNLLMPTVTPKSPVISRSSPEAEISSLAPLASESIPCNSEKPKPMSETLLVSNAVNFEGQQAHGAPQAIHSFQGVNSAEQPNQRLIKVVNSVSFKALSSSALDMGSVVCLTDRISGSDTSKGSRTAIGDLADMANFHLQERYFAWQESTIETRVMKRRRSMPISYWASEDGSRNDSLSHPSDMETFDLDAPAISCSKRRRPEGNRLLEEITAINYQLIDTVLHISDEDTIPLVASAPVLDGEGTIIRCSLVALSVAPNLKYEWMSAPMLPIRPLRLLVPANYPLCSPIFLDKLKVEVSDEDLSAKVMLKLSVSIKNLAEPLSLGEIARTWDVCARAVISEYAEQHGGGSFSSKYGTWEDCLSAAAA